MADEQDCLCPRNHGRNPDEDGVGGLARKKKSCMTQMAPENFQKVLLFWQPTVIGVISHAPYPPFRIFSTLVPIHSDPGQA
jgi:hypothetical protein